LIALGFYILVVQRRWILGALLMLVNAAWLGVLLGFVIPALGGGVAYRHWTYDALGTGPLSAATHVIRHPIDSLKLLFTPAAKTLAEVRTYLPNSRVAEINECLGTIPAGAGVTASNTLVPHLSHRAAIYEITLQPMADYVAVDPSTYSDFFAGEEDQLRNVV